MSTRAPKRSAADTDTDPSSALFKGFRLDTPSGRGELLTLVLVFLGPILAFLISPWFLLILVVALAASLITVPRAARARGERSRLAQAGLAMGLNGALLFLSMIVIGFIDDFVYHGREGFRGFNIVAILTVVHILLGVGIQLWDSFKE